MSTRLINAVLACLSALAMGAVLLLGTTIDDHSAERATADSLQDSIKAEAVQARFERAAQAMCGSNAAWLDLGGGTVQCLTHRGFKTIIAKVQP